MGAVHTISTKYAKSKAKVFFLQKHYKYMYSQIQYSSHNMVYIALKILYCVAFKIHYKYIAVESSVGAMGLAG